MANQLPKLFVAECSEFHSLGRMYFPQTVQEAKKTYIKVNKESGCMIPSIGIDYDEYEMDLLIGRTLDLSMLQFSPEFTQSESVMALIEEIKKEFPDAEIIE